MAKQQPGFSQSAQARAHTKLPMVTVDKNAAYPVAMEALKGDETLAAETNCGKASGGRC